VEGLLVTSLPVPAAVQRPKPSDNVEYGSLRPRPPSKHIPVFIKRLHFPGRSITEHDETWNAWRERNLKVLRDRISEVRKLDIEGTLEAYGYRYEDDPCAVVPRTCGGNILQYAIGPPELPEAVKIALLLDVARAIDHLHSQRPPVVHGGVHPTEIVINDEGRAVLLDFGLNHVVARLESPPAWAISTRRAPWGGYYAPEIVERKSFTTAIDVFAFAGVILAVMSELHPHFDCFIPEVAHIARGMPKPSAHPKLPAEHPLWRIMEEMWNPDETQRPSITAVVESLEGIMATYSCVANAQGAREKPVFRPQILTSHPDELSENALHRSRQQPHTGGCTISTPEIPDLLDNEYLPEFSGTLKVVDHGIAQGAYSRVSRCNWIRENEDGSSLVVEVAVKTLIINHRSNGNTTQQQEYLKEVGCVVL
ncbi:hypothetical protein FS837_000809, partial [Tulasnella sp. UAMH 9824]